MTHGSSEELWELTLTELASVIRSRQVSIEEVTSSTLARIHSLNPVLNCFITVSDDLARSMARDAERELRNGPPQSPLHGVPVSLKDNIQTVGLRTTGGSPTLIDWVPDRDAVVVRHLRGSGAVIVGKTNLQQFAYGASHPTFGEPRNPHDLALTCGGSSSGSVAAVAAGLGYGSVGTDTGGSIRIPAAFCGVVGLKPTYGYLSRSGVIPVSANLDHVGPIARSVRDCAALLDAMAGPTTPRLFESDAFVSEGLDGIRVGVVREQDEWVVADQVSAALDEVARNLASIGATVEEVSLPSLKDAQSIMWLVSGVEAREYHRHSLPVDSMNPLLRRRLEAAEFVSAVDYVRAQRVRQFIQDEVDKVFEHVDVLLLPTVGVTPYPRGTARLRVGVHDEESPEVGSRLTAVFNVTGHPVIAAPFRTGDAPPISFQVAAARWREDLILKVANAYEKEHGTPRPVSVETPQTTATRSVASEGRMT